MGRGKVEQQGGASPRRSKSRRRPSAAKLKKGKPMKTHNAWPRWLPTATLLCATLTVAPAHRLPAPTRPRWWCRGRQPAATGIGSTADALGNLLGACAAEYQRLAADADADRSAGIECEWRYNALTK